MTRYTNTGRKRTYLEAGFGDDLEPVAEAAGNPPGTPSAGPSKKRAHKASKTNRSKDEIDRKHSSEARRLRRIEQKQTDTICFACREQGHTAKACPKSSVLDDDGLPRETIGLFIGAGRESTHYRGAKNLRIQKSTSIRILLHLGQDVYFSGEHMGGADEDDFHSLKRRRAVVDQEEKFEQRRERTARKEARVTPNPSLVNGVPIKRPSGSKPKVVAF
ncbi:hypothetical protein RhiLY_07286 [Ceratobasidium sp. AG-Ba]|nr:hypothetical protein RhiLY_07286 [Ceratobasidium sp. AG-Ba]